MNLQERLAIGMANLYKLKGQCYLNLVDDFGLSEMSLKQINYLKTLNQSCGMTTSQLAEVLDLSKPTVTEMVKKFIKMDLVYKKSCPADGRVYYLMLTEKGQRIADVDKLTNNFLASKIVENLEAEDVEILIKILSKIE